MSYHVLKWDMSPGNSTPNEREREIERREAGRRGREDGRVAGRHCVGSIRAKTRARKLPPLVSQGKEIYANT